MRGTGACSGTEPLITARNAAESGIGDEQLIFPQIEKRMTCQTALQ